MSAPLNETHPEATIAPKGLPNTRVYSALRRFNGSNLIVDYERDVLTLATVLQNWQAKGYTVVWLAPTPQHFGPFGPFDVAHLQSPLHARSEWRPVQPNSSCLKQVPREPQIRNAVSLPIVRAHGIHVVNTWEALRQRGDMHHGGDCTHWCEPGDVVWFLASVVLGSWIASRAGEGQ